MRAPAALALAVALLVGSAWGAGLLDRWEGRGLDALFAARPAFAAHPPDPRIVLIGVQETDLERVGKPMVFWHPEFAEVMAALREVGARAVGFDFVLKPSVAGLPPAAREAFDEGELALTAEILQGRVALIEMLLPEGEPLRSREMLHMAAAANDDAVAANMVTDPDGTVRRADLFFTQGRTRSLAGRLAEKATGQELALRDGRAWFGAAEVPLDRQGHLLVDFPERAPVHGFGHLLRAVRSGRLPQEFRDRICLVGPAMPSAQDTHLTAAGLREGFEIHAAVLQNLLSGRFLRPASPWLGWLAVGGMALGGTWLAFALAPLRALLLLALGLELWFVAALAAFTQGVWLPVAAPALAALLAWSGGYALRYVTVDRRRREVQAIFGRFVSPPVMRELLRDPGRLALGGTRRRATFLFSDINDFSPTCGSRPPEEILGMLNRFFEEMVSIVFRNGGNVKQFVGDEIMAIFGAPDAYPDHAARAVRTAVEMVERLAEMERESAGRPGFYAVKIGVHTGEAVVGNVGSMERSEYAAVGDDVNIAARIEARTKVLGATLLVSEATRLEAEPLLPEFEWIPRGAQDLKGIVQPIPVYEVRRRGRTALSPVIAGNAPQT